jgi:hypothetical protein
MELSYSLLGQKYYWQEPSAPLLGQKTWRTPSMVTESVLNASRRPERYLITTWGVRPPFGR